jgi:hypothetical protein
MSEFTYAVRGFLTIRTTGMHVPLNGSLAVHADMGSGDFTGELLLDPSTVSRTILGTRLFGADVQVTAESPVIGRVDEAGRVSAAVAVDAVITEAGVMGQRLISGGSCRTAGHAVVPLRSEPGFALERGGRLGGQYNRPSFAGCGWITPLVNRMLAAPDNAVLIDLIPAGGYPGALPGQ